MYIDLCHYPLLNIMYNIMYRWNSLQDADWRSGLCLAFYLCYCYDLQVRVHVNNCHMCGYFIILNSKDY